MTQSVMNWEQEPKGKSCFLIFHAWVYDTLCSAMLILLINYTFCWRIYDSDTLLYSLKCVKQLSVLLLLLWLSIIILKMHLRNPLYLLFERNSQTFRRCKNSILRNVFEWHTHDCGVTGGVQLFRWFQFSCICLFKGSVEHKTKPCKMFDIGFMKTAGVGHKGGEEPHDPFIFHFWLLERIRLFYWDSRLL